MAPSHGSAGRLNETRQTKLLARHLAPTQCSKSVAIIIMTIMHDDIFLIHYINYFMDQRKYGLKFS